MGKALTDIDIERFADEYMLDLNVTRAAERCGIPRRTAFEMIKRDEVHAAIARKHEARAVKVQIRADDVLRHVHAIAMGDVNELVQVRRANCRHCHGEGHRYQYVNKAALEGARGLQGRSDLGLVEEFTHGGVGFNPAREPHPECPECGGEGTAYVHVTDSRHLPSNVRALYAGAKQTKDGVEVKIASRDKALELLMRHLGLLNDKLEVKGELSLVERILNARKKARGT